MLTVKLELKIMLSLRFFGSAYQKKGVFQAPTIHLVLMTDAEIALVAVLSLLMLIKFVLVMRDELQKCVRARCRKHGRKHDRHQ